MFYYLLKINLYCNYFVKEIIILKWVIEVYKNIRMLRRDGGLESVVYCGIVERKFKYLFK